MAKSRLTNEQKETIKSLYNAGTTVRALSKMYEVSDTTIYNILTNKTRIRLSDIGMDRRRKLTLAEVAEIKQDFEHGRNLNDLAKAYHVSITCIRYHCFPELKEYINNYSKEHHYQWFTVKEERIKQREYLQYYRRCVFAYKQKEAINEQ